jgi:glycerophosphoryl diester phosphodiesterase
MAQKPAAMVGHAIPGTLKHSIMNKYSLAIIILAILLISGCRRNNCGTYANNTHTVKTIAHRGFWNSPGAAQNSLAALRNAQALGCYAAELDIRITADGIPVLNHDKDIDNVIIETATFDQIKNKTLSNGETIPTLQQYLRQGKLHPKTLLIIEIKPHSTEIINNKAVEITLQTVADAGMNERIEYISFSINICREIIRRLPSAKVAYLGGDKSPAELNDMKISGIDYNIEVLRRHPEYIKQAHQLGMTVNVWTVSNPREIEEMTALGVDYITTDNPEECVKIQ